MYVGLGFVISLPALAQAVQGQISGDPNTPGNQRPTVLETSNNVPLVNIQTPSSAGVSRNTYDQFDVGTEGAILNNARANVQTQLGGWVQGNPSLATGTARVILNEVNSAHPSHLTGYVEVAGDRAEVIIANPSGIQVSNGGFINASRATLTTGRPILKGGALDGYRVEGSGAIQVNGAGLDASRSDYTDLIARSVQLNAGVWANRLKVTMGANKVSADHTQITKVDGDRGAVPQFALDVSALGGMYANHIALIGTEAGVGVTNAGTIGAQVGDLTVTVDGRLINTSALQSQQNTRLNATGGVTNAGTLSAVRELTVTTPADVNNEGGTLNARRIEVNASSLTNRGGAIEQSGVQALALNAGSLGNRDGGRIGMAELSGGSEGGSGSHGEAAGGDGSGAAGGTDGPTGIGDSSATGSGSQSSVIPLADGALNIAGLLNNDGGRIRSSGGMDLASAQGLNNDGGHLALRRLTLKGGDLRNAGGELTVTGPTTLHVGQVNNDAGQLKLAGALTLDAHDFSNRAGTLSHSGADATTLKVAGTIDNTDGVVASNASALTVSNTNLLNERGRIEQSGTNGLTIRTGVLTGAGGTIATAGAVNLTATQANHRSATLSATQITLSADTFDSRGGHLIASGAAANILSVRGTLDNGDGGTIESNGDLTISAATFGNAGGTVRQAGTGALAMTANALNGAGGTLGSNGSLTITGDTTDLRDGTTSAQRIRIDTGKLTTAGGTLTATGAGSLDLRVRGALDNATGTIATTGALQLDAASLNNSDGVLSAAGEAKSRIEVAQTLDNTRGTIASAEAMGLTSDQVLNRAGMISAGDALGLAVAQALDNRGGTVVASSRATVRAGSVRNGEHGVIASLEDDLHLTADGLLDNAGGALQADGDIALDSAGLENANGQIVGANTTIDTRQQALGNAHGTIAATSGTLAMAAHSAAIDNSNGYLRGDNVRLTGAALRNAGGTVQAGTNLTASLTGDADNTGGLIATGGALDLTAVSVLNRDTLSADPALVLGLQGDKVTLNAKRVDNSAGLIVASTHIGVAGSGTGSALTNTGGTVSSAASIGVTVDQITNTGGTLFSGTNQTHTANGMTGDGTVLSQGDLTIALQQDYVHTGEVTANGKLDIRTAGTLINHSLIQAGDLTVSGATIDNAVDGTISGGRTHVVADTDLTNRGLIDGGATRIDAVTLANVGTGRIYGDQVAIQAGTVSNHDETVKGETKAATIASRGDLDLGAGELVTRSMPA
ncbi:filamentous hemagglutinin family N-terminal domain-containing protein [Pseudoxanthomonas indica]|uniref:Filamentous hemagglutinin family N-terminal domain-containing protein n=2 Tax=Pseudoxanthomonas indica TaxID=428993 RepID=A0A1T5KC33_9GAMM|nr:filamentous hemagglutinin family N-terminal domain-containing protein [Pseudoxanthomonas indica]